LQDLVVESSLWLVCLFSEFEAESYLVKFLGFDAGFGVEQKQILRFRSELFEVCGKERTGLSCIF